MLEMEKYAYEEEEISLYDIVDIVLKYKKKIALIVLLGLVTTIVGIFVERGMRKQTTSQEYRIQYNLLEENKDYNKIQLNYVKFDPSYILRQETYIDNFLKIPKLQELYSKKKDTNSETEVLSKQKFIQEIIKIDRIKGNDENSLNGNYTIKVTLDKNIKIAPQILEIYFSILEEKINQQIEKLLLEKKEDVQKKKLDSEVILEDISNQLANSFNPSFQDLNKEALEFNLRLKYPLLIGKKDVYEPMYKNMIEEEKAIEFILQSGILSKVVEKNPEILIEPPKSNTKFVLLIGIIMTFCFAFAYIVLSEFRTGYQKHKQK